MSIICCRKWFNYFTLLVEKLGFARGKLLQMNCGYVFENCIIRIFVHHSLKISSKELDDTNIKKATSKPCGKVSS